MIGGQGIYLPPPQATVPGLPQGQPYTLQSQLVAVSAGAGYLIPPGWWLIKVGRWTQVQWRDYVSTCWLPYMDMPSSLGVLVNSDGSNFRVQNITGVPASALVTANGTGYSQATTTCTLSVGNSTWQPIVGNAVTSIAVGNDSKGNAGGTNFTMPPIVDVMAPPQMGVSATAYATIVGGAISAITMINQGGGYTAGVPNVIIRPNPFDPNIASITIPACTATLGGGTATNGDVVAVLCTNNGRLLTAGEIAGPPTLTIAGSGSSATASPVIPQVITAVAWSNSGGVAYAGTAVKVGVVGGNITAAPATIASPIWGPDIMHIREANISAPVSGGAVGAAAIVDGGLFLIAPTGITLAAPGTSAPSTLTVPSFTMGSANDNVWMQQLGGWS